MPEHSMEAIKSTVQSIKQVLEIPTCLKALWNKSVQFVWSFIFDLTGLGDPTRSHTSWLQPAQLPESSRHTNPHTTTRLHSVGEFQKIFKVATLEWVIKKIRNIKISKINQILSFIRKADFFFKWKSLFNLPTNSNEKRIFAIDQF